MRAVVVYAAKSTADGHGSIGTQLAEGRERAEAEGWPVIGAFQDEDESAYHGNRGDGLAQAMALCERTENAVLIVQHSDRLARGDGKEARHLVEVAIWAIKHGVRLVSLQDPEMLAEGDFGLLMSAIGGMRNHQDSKRKAQSVKAGIERRRARGKAWGEPPLGYRIEKRVEGSEVTTFRVIDPDVAQIIEALFAGLDSGMSTGSVARKLNRAGHRTRRGSEFTARRVRAMAENADYKGAGPYPTLIEPDLWDRVNAKIARTDPAALQAAKGGREPLAEFMLRRLCWCGECGQPMYALVRHGKRIYECRTKTRRTGTCQARAIPAEVAEERILEWLTLFMGDVAEWIEGQLAERSDEQAQLERALDAEKAKLATLEAKREARMAELEDVGITPLGLEVIERIDQERALRTGSVADLEARLAEWTAPSNDGVLAYYERLVEFVRGKVASADGVAAINAALHDSLLGIWLRLDSTVLYADIRLRPTGDDDLDAVVADLFGTLAPDPEMIEAQRWQLRDTPPIYAGSTTPKSSTPSTNDQHP